MRWTFTNSTTGMTSLSIGFNPTIGTNHSVFSAPHSAPHGQCEGSSSSSAHSHPQKLLLGIPIKTAIIENTESARGTMGRRKRREPIFSLFPSHRAPRALFFFLPSTQIGTSKICFKIPWTRPRRASTASEMFNSWSN